MTLVLAPACFSLCARGLMLFNNIDDGYLEGLLRGYRSGVLTSTDYANLCQCESIDDVSAAAAPQQQQAALS